MSYDVDKLNFKPGDQLAAADLQAMLEALRRPGAIVRGGAGVDVRQGARGQVQITGTSPLRFVGVANGNITARSGSTWGTGSVTRYGFDGTHDYTTSVNYDVVNPSSTKMGSGNGIDSGQYCWVEEDSDGHLVVMPLECS